MEDIEEGDHPSCKSTDHSPQKSKSTRYFGLDLFPDHAVLAIVALYFVQGFFGLSRLSVGYPTAENPHLDAAEKIFFRDGLFVFPSFVKPLCGFISDSIPLYGSRRRSYLILSGLVGALSWSILAIVHSKFGTDLCVCFGSVAVAFFDVVADSIIMERIRNDSQSISGSILPLCWGSSACGGFLSASLCRGMLKTHGARFVFHVRAFLLLVASALAVVTKEKSISPSGKGNKISQTVSYFIGSFKQNMMKLRVASKQSDICLPILFLFLWQAIPKADTPLILFCTSKMFVDHKLLGKVNLHTSSASLLGVTMYCKIFKNKSLQQIFRRTAKLAFSLCVLQFLFGIGVSDNLGITDEWFAIGNSIIVAAIYQACFMSVLVSCARLCSEGVEATLVSTLRAISSAGGVAGELSGIYLGGLMGNNEENFDHLLSLFLLCTLFSLLPLSLLRFLPRDHSPDFTPREDRDIEETKLKD